MGEFADYAVDEAMDEDDWRADYQRGDMSIDEALDKGIINEQGGEDA